MKLKHDQLLDSLKKLVEANPRNSHKGQWVTQWFQENFNVEGRCSHVTEAKQAYNRADEQLRHDPDYAIFVLEEDVPPKVFIPQVIKRAKDTLRGVLLLQRTQANDFQGLAYISEELTNVGKELLRMFPSAKNVPLRERTGTEITRETEESSRRHLARSLNGLLAAFQRDAESGNIWLETNIVHRVVGSLLAKRFLILTGLSGSGKTKIAQAFAQWITPSDREHYRLVAVGADWTASDNILGYPNGLDEKRYITTPALDLLLQAGTKESADIPHFLILDEMNLSHVERYFADFLSLIESGGKLTLYPGNVENPQSWREARPRQPIPPCIEKLPDNLFIIGTVNVDETTYMFSPKVLDRANVLEFRMPRDDLERFLDSPRKPDLGRLTQRGHDDGFGKAFAKASIAESFIPENVKGAYEEEMLLFFDILKDHGAEFGYRTAHEAARFVHFFKLLGGYEDEDSEWFPGAFDCVVVQKFLPKLHGSRSKLGPLLKALWFLCVTNPEARGEKPVEAAQLVARSTDPKEEPSMNRAKTAHYPLSADKIARMWRLLKDNGFASFAEA